MPESLLERLGDRQRACVMLRADGWSYNEIATFLDCDHRRVRSDLEGVAKAFPGLLDHRREANAGRLMRLVYLLGVEDAGVPMHELADYLDSLPARALWLRSLLRLGDGSDSVG